MSDPRAKVVVQIGATSTGERVSTDDDGTFRLVSAELEAGEYGIRAVAVRFGLRSELSAPTVAVVDPDPPVVQILSPERGSAIPSQNPVVASSVYFGRSGGTPDDVSVVVNADTASADFKDGVFAVSNLRFPDGRVVLVSVRAAKLNCLITT